MKKINLKNLIKENIEQYGTHGDGKLIFKDGDKYYDVVHFSGGTSLVVKDKAPKFIAKLKKQKNVDMDFVKKIKKTLANPKNDMGNWWNVEY